MLSARYALRYASAFSLNRLEGETKDGLLDIPKCQKFYDALRIEILGSYNPCFHNRFGSILNDFDACVQKYYPELFYRYKELEIDGQIYFKNYSESIFLSKRNNIVHDEVKIMYKRTAERIMKDEEKRKKELEKAGMPYVPSKIADTINKINKRMELIGVGALKGTNIH